MGNAIVKKNIFQHFLPIKYRLIYSILKIPYIGTFFEKNTLFFTDYSSNENLTNFQIGRAGEKIACRFLLAKNYQIIEKNFITPFGEIDIIARDGNYIVFIEIKTRSTEYFGCPLSGITEYKQKNILRNAAYYIKSKSSGEKNFRIDAIGITLDQQMNPIMIKHVENIIAE
ncbi:Uncharacterized protein family UPF0102 domain protein [Candidatus Omnitrophus magneticus]|uniref:UPF0102 protein OMAG_002846 n=1 Tax=Candidatus Omnitrophus magneticus TaxID=1609969 RepID=A0A0F0CJB4_9BACT|nr:Uncharacterized protein family UPF0102 domain protein [Candidatus Omnitrophus magneticus]